MGNSSYRGNIIPKYGNGSPVYPLEQGNIDISVNGVSRKLARRINKTTMVHSDGPSYLLIPKFLPSGADVDDAKAVSFYNKTKGHFGRFESEEAAKTYRDWLGPLAKEIMDYFPEEDIISESPESVQSSAVKTMAAVNRSLIRSHIKQVLSISKKALGSSIRRLAERFDPNAIDGDEDGFVQDGTAYARPALPGAPAVTSMRSLGTPPPPSNEVKRAAARMAALLKKEEPRVTSRIKDIESMSDGKAKLVDLDKRLKSVESYAAKIERLKGNWDNDIAAAASQMNDGLRYTFVVGKGDDYSSFVRSTIAMLQADGHRVTAWNYWNSKDPYNGIHAMVGDPNGFNYEIQFHTPKSMAAKKKLEPLYNRLRDESDSAKRQAIYERMKGLSTDSDKPLEAENIGSAVEKGHTVATFTPEMLSSSLRSARSKSTTPRKADALLFPEGESATLTSREKKMLDKLTEEWSMVIAAAVQGDSRLLPPLFPKSTVKPTVAEKSKGGQNPGTYVPGGARGVRIGADDVRAETLARIFANVAEMADRGDYSFLWYAPVLATEDPEKSGISWWNNRLQQLPLQLRDRFAFLQPRLDVGKHPTATRVEKAPGKNPGEIIERTVPVNASVSELSRLIGRRAEARLVKNEQRGRTGISASHLTEEERAQGVGRAISLQTPRGDDGDELGDTIGVIDQGFDDDSNDAVAGEFVSGGFAGDVLPEAEGIVGQQDVVETQRRTFYGIPDTLPTEQYVMRLESLAEGRNFGGGKSLGMLSGLYEQAPIFVEMLVDFFFKNMSRQEAETKYKRPPFNFEDYMFRMFYEYADRGVDPDRGPFASLGRILGQKGSKFEQLDGDPAKTLQLIDEVLNDPEPNTGKWREKHGLSNTGYNSLKFDWRANKEKMGVSVVRRTRADVDVEATLPQMQKAIQDALGEGPVSLEDALRIMRIILGETNNPKQANTSNWLKTMARSLRMTPDEVRDLLRSWGLRMGGRKDLPAYVQFKVLDNNSHIYRVRTVFSTDIIANSEYLGLGDEIAEEPQVDELLEF